MTRTELLEVLGQMVVEITVRHSPERASERDAILADLRTRLTPDASLFELGWDSMQLTWLLVRVEERFDIDTSTLSLLDLFTVDDLLRELQVRIDARGA